jgi:hypothetical protein
MWSRVPWESDLGMTALARPSSNCKLQAQSSRQRRCYIKTMKASIQLKNAGRESQGAFLQDELIGVKPPAVK